MVLPVPPPLLMPKTEYPIICRDQAIFMGELYVIKKEIKEFLDDDTIKSL
jgi:hypothetical protein